MPFSAKDIEGRTFPLEFRGYDRAAVDEFLRELASEFRSLERAAVSPSPSSRTGTEVSEWGCEPGTTPNRDLAEPPNLLLLRTREEARRVIDAAEELSLRIVDSARRSRQEAEEDAAKIVRAAQAKAVKYLDRALECNEMLVRVEQGLRPPREAFEAALNSFRDALTRGDIEDTPRRPPDAELETAPTHRGPLSRQLRELRDEVLAGNVGREDGPTETNGHGGDDEFF